MKDAIGGVKLTMHVKLNGLNSDSYKNILFKLQEEIAQTIELEGHELLFGTGDPILKSKLSEE